MQIERIVVDRKRVARKLQLGQQMARISGGHSGYGKNDLSRKAEKLQSRAWLLPPFSK